jgi:hypothetical protein
LYHLSKIVTSFNINQRRLEALEAADFGLFTALWWPDAQLEQLETLAYLIIWLFTWDDEIDEPGGIYADDLDGAQTFREQTLLFVSNCLGLSAVAADFKPLNQIVQSFDVIGSALRHFYDKDQRQHFYDEVARFMIASETEQRFRIREQIPTLEEYWNFRLGTSAVYISSAAGEYSISCHLPRRIVCSGAMKALWNETNIIISITNDLLSLRKEIRQGCVNSIVPLTFAATNDVQTAITATVEALKASKERFDYAATDLLTASQDDQDLYPEINRFIEVQRSNCVGNLLWR